MEARKFATQMAAICPFAVVIGMGYTVRKPVPGHHVLQYSEAQNARLAAYRSLALDEFQSDESAVLTRRRVDQWIRLAKTQNLQALTPAYEEDLSEDNARSDIITRWRLLQQRLNHSMRNELEDGQVALAVEDGTRLIRLN